MTNEEIYLKYGKCELFLVSGYKHRFTYRGKCPLGDNLEVTVGDGNPGTIYKTHIEPTAMVDHLAIEEFYVKGNLVWEYGDV